jgi:hypothetical protein
MKTEIGTVIFVLVLGVLCQPAVAGEQVLLATRVTEDIETVRVNLNSWGLLWALKLNSTVKILGWRP